MSDSGTDRFRLTATATFRPADSCVGGTDERGLIRVGDSFTIDAAEGRGKRLRSRLLAANLADLPDTKIVYRGSGWYDVVDEEGRVLNEKAIHGGAAAKEFAEERTEE